MAKVHSVTKCRTSHQFDKAIHSQGGWRESGGKHDKLCHPDGGKVPIPRHSGDIFCHRSVTKMLLVVGFLAFSIFCCVTYILLPIGGAL